MSDDDDNSQGYEGSITSGLDYYDNEEVISVRNFNYYLILICFTLWDIYRICHELTTEIKLY